MNGEHAYKYNVELGLGLKSTTKKTLSRGGKDIKKQVLSGPVVRAFVENTSNDKSVRIGLLNAFNKEQERRFLIELPDDLTPSKVFTFGKSRDFREHDSDDDDLMDIKETIKQSKSGDMTLYRPSNKGKDKEEEIAPILPFEAMIRIGRQIVKRNVYSLLPIVMQINDSYIEMKDPGTLDIYGTPLVKASKGRFKRGGTSSDFNWLNLGTKLDQEVGNDSTEPPRKKRRILGPFKGKMPEKMTPGEIEAVGAISCDYFKGSGTSEFIYEVKQDKTTTLFKDLFTKIYKPGGEGGRSLVVKKTKELKKRKQQTKMQSTNTK